jgi:hypothetical protein
MTVYTCKNCDYKTNNEQNYSNHLNRKIPCTLSNKKGLHGNSKEYKKPYCPHCKKEFSRNDVLKKHNKKFHINNEGSDNKQIIGDHNNNQNGDHHNNNKQIIGDHNNNQIGDHNNNQIGNHNTLNKIDTQNITIEKIIVKNYDSNDINDLTLLEQYLTLTSEISPYHQLLNYLNVNHKNPKFYNINLPSLTKSNIKVITNNSWITKNLKETIDEVFNSKRLLIGLIFNRFRFFFSNKAVSIIPRKYYFGDTENLHLYKKYVVGIKNHLYDNNLKNKNNKIDTSLPNKIKPTESEQKEIFWAISKNYTWNEITETITEMNENNINFDTDLGEIKKQLLSDDVEFKNENLFKKLIKRITRFIKERDDYEDWLSKKTKKTKKELIYSSPETSDEESYSSNEELYSDNNN